MAYQRVERINKRTPAPEVHPEQVMSIAGAAKLLGVAIPTLSLYINRGRFTEIIDESETTPRGTPRRYVLRNEVELAAGRARRSPRSGIAERTRSG